MVTQELAVSKYRRLLQLLDEDAREMSQCIQGEILDAYLRILEQEKEILQNALRAMQENI